ncbi:MAG: TonB-dependent receptor [Acidobacteriaceae bacterium]
MKYTFYRAFVLFLICGCFSLPALAQDANSSIKGTVTDTHGAVVSGATVTLTNIGTNQSLSTTSNADGFYTFVNLAPANYKLSVTVSGFADWVGVLTLRVSQAALVDATMNAASVATQVTVRDVTPVIDSVNPTISDVKNSTAIETIPVANRNILNVLAFSPGVVAGSYGGSGAGNTRINGMPPGSVDFLVDGQSMTNRNTNELQQNAQPTPTFQEVKVITAQGNAQYGAPGVVELVTKSGTNHFHGQIYELNQNNHLQAKVFNQRNAVPFLQHNEYGFQIGGPVWIPKLYNGRNKTFFFFDAERVQQNANKVEQYFVPTMSERQGNLSDVLANTTGAPVTIYDPNSTSAGAPYTRTVFGGNSIPANRLNPVTQKIFGVTPVAGLAALPEPNIPSAQVWNGQPNYVPASSKATTDNKLYTVKVDQLFGPNRLAARYTYTDNKQLSPEYYAPTEPDQAEYGGHNGSLTFTQVVSPSAINVAHIGIQYDNHVHSGPVPIADVSSLLGLPTYQTNQYWPQFYYNNYGSSPDGYWTGIDRDNPKDYPDQTISASDQFSYTKGNHQMMFGFDYNNYRVTTDEIGQPGGNYDITGLFTAEQDPGQPEGTPVSNTGLGLADFLLGNVAQLSVNVYPVYHTRQSEYDGYAQDDWRVTQKLTLNLGLRYEYWTAFGDASGLTSTFNPNATGSADGNGMVIYQGSGALPAQTSPALYSAFQAQGLPIESAAAANYPLSLFNMPKNNFDPRVGFAYQLDDKTVLRGGYGIYRFVLPLIAFQQATRDNAPFSYFAQYQIGEVSGPGGTSVPNQNASQLEFPNAQAQYGGTQPLNQFMLGNQSNCSPATFCNPPGLAINPGNAAASITQGSGFSGNYMDPNYNVSMVQEYNLTFARELPFHTGFQLSYIGNHSSNLLMQDPLNVEIPRGECASGVNCTRTQRSLYTSFANPIYYYRYDGYANTNELQAQLTHTWGNGLTLQTYFTWMKALTTSEFGLSNAGTPAGSAGGQSHTDTMIPAALTPGYDVTQIGSGASTADRLRAVYSNDPTLPTKTFQLNAHYQLPFGKGQRFLGNAHGIVNDLVTGYNISAFFLWHSGFYFSPYFTQFSSGTVSPGGSGQAINLSPGKTGVLPKDQRNAAHWFDASVWDPSTGPYAGQAYTLGTSLQGDFRNNIPSNYMTGPGFNNLDANVYKLTPLWRNLVLDMEAQVFNIYNHQNLGMPNTQGAITTTAGGAGVNGAYPRTIQLQAKIVF